MSETTQEPKKRGKSIDWEQVEGEYRANVLSIREIAKKHDISDKAVRNKAKDMGWERDLMDKVQQKVRAQLVRSEVRTDAEMRTEKEIVDTAAAQVVSVLRSHRGHIARGMRLSERLMTELEATLDQGEEIAAAIDEETTNDKGPARRKAMHKAISLHQHSITLGNITALSRTWIALERQAFNIPDDETPPPPPTPMDELTDDEIDRRIAELAKEAGIGFAAVRESAQDAGK